MGVRLSLMDWMQSLIVKILEKIISVNTIRDIEESYLVPKNPMPLGVGVSEGMYHLKCNQSFGKIF